MTDTLAQQIEQLLTTGDLAERVENLNALRELIAEHSPFRTEPVDFVRWVPNGQVHANDYNPNSVAPPEMELLRLSIAADGYTQPIVAMAEEDCRHVRAENSDTGYIVCVDCGDWLGVWRCLK